MFVAGWQSNSLPLAQLRPVFIILTSGAVQMETAEVRSADGSGISTVNGRFAVKAHALAYLAKIAIIMSIRQTKSSLKLFAFSRYLVRYCVALLRYCVEEFLRYCVA